MNRIKVWPHLTVVAVVVALIAGAGVVYWMKGEPTASAEELPYAARIQRVDGEVAFSDSLAKPDSDAEWTAATANQPFSTGDRIYTRDNSRTSLAFSGRNFARLDQNTSLDVVSLGEHHTQLALRDGSAMFDVGYLEPDESFEVGTPYGAVNFEQPGLYNMSFDDNGGVLVSVLSGLARVVGQSGSGEINKGEMLTLVGQAASELALSRLNHQDAGYQVDDYYRYQYQDYDGRYSNYDAYLSDPYYYDPYRRNASYQYASSSMPGINDLDYYGDWQNVGSYGYAWRPRVDSGWVPYQQGQWTNDYPYGPTWVSSEPWGYAPYHYGRWANVDNQWYWIPERVNTRPSYSPALVAFISLNDSNEIGWVPLGPGDIYAPRYYDDNWQPRYLTRANVVPGQLFNYGFPGAVTFVNLDAFGRPIDARSIRRIDQQRLALFRPTLDPLTLTPLRNAVIHSAWGRGKIDLPPGIAKKLRDRQVFVSGEIREPRFRKDLAKSMRVERVSDQGRSQKFKVKDNRDATDARGVLHGPQPADIGRKQEKETRAQQPTQKPAQQKAERKAAPQPQGVPVANPAKQQSPGATRKSSGAAKPEAKKAPSTAGAQGNAGGGKGKGKP